MKKITVIITCYKDSLTLENAILSVYAQSRKIDEIIIVNDNSPESFEIESIIKKYPNII